MHIVIKKVRRYIPNVELVSDLMRVSRALGKNIVSTRDYERLGSFNSSTLITRFGSWNRAIIEAGLMPVKNSKPSKHALLDNMLDVWRALGRQPRLKDMTLDVSAYSRGAYIKSFGSWITALEELQKYLTKNDVAHVLRTCLSARRADATKADMSYPEPLTATDLSVRRTDATGVPRTPTARLRMAVMKRDKFRCVLCGRTPANDSAAALEIDHVIPWSKGGQSVMENLQTLCSECNNGKSDSFE